MLLQETSAVSRGNFHPHYGAKALVHQEHNTTVRGKTNYGDRGHLSFLLRHTREGPGRQDFQALSIQHKEAQKTLHKSNREELVAATLGSQVGKSKTVGQ